MCSRILIGKLFTLQESSSIPHPRSYSSNRKKTNDQFDGLMNFLMSTSPTYLEPINYNLSTVCCLKKHHLIKNIWSLCTIKQLYTGARQKKQPGTMKCFWGARVRLKQHTWPQTRVPMPRKMHHNHCSMVRADVWNAMPPNCVMIICTRNQISSSLHTSVNYRGRLSREHRIKLGNADTQITMNSSPNWKPIEIMFMSLNQFY